LIACSRPQARNEDQPSPCPFTPVLVLQADATRALILEHGDDSARSVSLQEFGGRYCGRIIRIAPPSETVLDPDSEAPCSPRGRFGFSWFAPELFKHKRLWREVLWFLWRSS
jgi:subfamily B ATP-binding cassette protein HlyB/CyaB